MFALRKALDMLFAEGLDNVFLRHRLLAEAVRRAIAVWKTGNVIDFNVVEPGDRSNAVTTVLTNGYDPKLLRAYCDTKCGVVLGHGIGKLNGKAFRIAHMGHLNASWARSASSRWHSARSVSPTARAVCRRRSNG